MADGNARKAKAQAAAPKPGPSKHGPSKPGPSKAVVGAVVAAVAIVAIVVAVIASSANTKQAGPGQAPANAVSDSGGIVAFPGKAKAGVPTLELWEDFQCPICGELEKAGGADITRLGQSGDVKLIYHILSFLDVNLRNDSSSRAAAAAACADDAGRFDAYHNAVFAGQPAEEGAGYTDAQLASFAGQAGITGAALDTWTQCYADKTYAQYVTNVQAQGEKDGVNATPTLRLNGKDVDLQKLVGDPTYLAAQVKAATK